MASTFRVVRFPCRGRGFEPDGVAIGFFGRASIGKIRGASWHPVIGPYGTVGNPISMHGQFPRHCLTATCRSTSAPVLRSHLPSELPRQHPYCQVTLPHQHPYNHLPYVLPHVILSLGHVTYGLPRVTSVQCHVSFSYRSNSARKCRNWVTRVTSSCYHVSHWHHLSYSRCQ